jgi:hypothetical protein
MLILAALALIDWLLPDVKIPLFAWILLILLWFCIKVVQEAKTPKAVKIVPAQKWIESRKFPLTAYSTADEYWAITVTTRKGIDFFTLWGEGDEESVNLSATSIDEAKKQADKIIYILEGK